MGYKLALDFGTTNTVLARWDEELGVAALFDVCDMSAGSAFDPAALVPSLVYVRDGRTGDIVAGQAVRRQRLDRLPGNRLFRNFKRSLVVTPAPDPRLIDGMLWTDREVGRVFLRHLLHAVELEPDDVDQLVVTAPVAAFDAYLGWLQGALDDVAPERIRVVDESTAAALGYAVAEPDALVLIVDFGGGTLDLALVQLPEGGQRTGRFLDRLRQPSLGRSTARVIAKAGHTLGGSDIDRWLFDETLKRVDLSPDNLGADRAPLLTLCEQAKIALSAAEETDIVFEAAGTVRDVRITRAELEAVMAANGFYTTLRHVVDQTLHEAHRRGVFLEDLSHVLLVGGVSLMPSVRAHLHAYFGSMAVRADKPFTAVVEGALQVALGLGLDDYLLHGYGLRHLDPDTGVHRYEEVIPMGSRLPISAPIEVLLGAAHPNQTEVEFVIGEIGVEDVSRVDVRFEDGQVVYVAQAERDAPTSALTSDFQAAPIIIRLDPPGAPGEDRLKASFVVDAQRRLRATVVDLKTKRELVRDVVVATLR